MSAARPTPTYPYQFQMIFGELLEQNATYKLNVIDGQAKIDQRQKDLELAKADIDQYGVYSSFRLKVWEKDNESLTMSKSALNFQRDVIPGQIEPLLVRILACFDDMQDDFSNSRLSRMQFASYLRSYKELLHQGNALALSCYNKYPVISRINEAIEKYISAEPAKN
jgi:hypothetical protein